MHLRTNKKIIIYIFLFLILGSINNKNFYNFNFFQTANINIEGLSEKEQLKIIESFKLLNLQSVFILDKNKIIEILNSNNLIENFFIFKKYPSSLEIKIKPAELLAKVNKNGKMYYLGSNGKLIFSEKNLTELPSIFGEFKNKDFFDLYQVINDTNFDFNNIKKLFFFNSGRWDIETHSGVLIKLPSEKFRKSFNISLKILNDDKFKEIKIIDLRQSNQVIING